MTISQEVVPANDYELDLGTPWAADRRYTPRLAARWLSPLQLVDAGIKQLVAGLFETYADRRDSMETRANVVLVHHDVTAAGARDTTPKVPQERPLLPGPPRPASGDGFWFDYVADIGDGFSPTYSVAAEIALTGISPKVKAYPGGPDGTTVVLRRGDLLVMGGDEVYPLAGDVEYRNRTIGPYETACRRTEPSMGLLAVPGNHDWYDGLSAFMARFCGEQWIGGWRTRQSRSYWAAHVQPGWWIWGIDIALERAPIDHHQLRYFTSVAAQLAPGDRIILVTAKPSWLGQSRAPLGTPEPTGAGGPPHDYEPLSYFMATTLEACPATQAHEQNPPRFALVLSGDKHFYCRYDNKEQGDRRLPHVVAGGGGAYLSLPFRQAETRAVRYRQARTGPTGTASGPRTEVCLKLDRERQWPEPEATKRLAVSAVWKMITRNWGFCAVLAAVYLLLAKIIQSGSRGDYTTSWAGNVARSFTALGSSPGRALVGVALVAALMLRSALPIGRRTALAVSQAALHLLALSTAGTLARAAVQGYGVSATSWSAIGLATIGLAWGGWGVWMWRLYRKVPTAAVGGLVGLMVLAGLVAATESIWDGLVHPESLTWTVALTGLASVLAGVAFATGLLVAVGLFGEQDNDLSVAVREIGYKNFLRLHIDRDSRLQVYAIGLEKVPHQRLRFRRAGEEHPGTPEVTACRMPRRGRNRYEPRIIDHFTVGGP